MIRSTLENVLIHLYLEVANEKQRTGRKHVPVALRNKIISEYIKPKIKDRRYATIKKDLKTVSLMRDRFGTIETHLLSIVGNENQKSDSDKLYVLISNLEIAGLPSELVDEKPEQREDVIYVVREHIINCFSDEGKQVAPLSLFIQSTDMTAFHDCLSRQSDFRIVLFESNDALHSYHYQLYHAK